MDYTTTHISAKSLARQLDHEGDLLTGRSFGKRFLAQLRELLNSMPRNSVLLLSFEGVEIMDGSFPDEVFATLSAARSRREFELSPLILAGVNESCRDSLQYALQSRPEREKDQGLRNCVLPLQEDVTVPSSLSLIGKWEEHVEQTFELLRRANSLNARQLATSMQLTVPAASTRLKVLYDLGLALRAEVRDLQGKQYIYHSIG